MSKGNRFIKTLLVLVLVLSIGRVLLPQSAVLAQAPLDNLSWAPRYMYGTDDNIVYTHYPEAVSGGWEDLPADTLETILGQLRRAEYRPTSLSTTYPGSYGALNWAHALSLTFDADGVHVLPAQHDGDDSVPAWDWALRLIGYGYCEAVEAALPEKPTVSGNRVEYQRGDLSEWYLNDERGLEQGFILARPPVAEAGNTLPLRIAMAIHTSLTPQLTDDGHTLLFHDAQGRVVLNYSELHAYDAGGAHLPTRMVLADDVADTMEHTLYLMVDDCGAKYPITIDPLLTQVAKLTASDGADWDCFGYSASISGDTVVVGAYYGGAGGVESGSAYVFERNHGGADNWGEVKELIASDAAAYDCFGWSVSISGDTVVVGAYSGTGSNPDSGSAYVFERNQGGADSWGEVKELIASDGAAGDWFGCAVSISGDTLVVGADSDDGSKGSAYVFERNQGGADNWGQFKKMIASDGATGDRFGFAVSISGDTVVVGANKDDGNKGSAYVFGRDQGGADSWGEVAKLTASDGAADDQFGDSVSISGDTVVVGATGDDGNKGSAYVFERNQGGADNWGQFKKLLASDGATGDYFGYSVSISGDILVVSAPNDNNYVGSAYEFERNEGGADNWGQVAKLTASDGAIGDCLGYSVSISGDTLVVGAPGDADNGSWSGSAYTFGLTPEMNLKEGATDIADDGGYDFGSRVNYTDTDITFTIENTGTAALTLTTPLTIGGANADQFSIQTQPTSPVAASGSTTFVVRFTPTSEGARTATIAIANNDSDEDPYDLTITGTSLEPPPPPWYDLQIDLLGTSHEVSANLAGRVRQTLEVTSDDGKLTVTIPQDTWIKQENGNRLEAFSVSLDNNPPLPPEGKSIIGLCYNFEPDGADFDPSITLTFHYEHADIPEGVAEEDLVLAFYDESSGEWIELECTCDPATDCITACISHFTDFTILASFPPPSPPSPEPVPPEPVPAAFLLSNLTVQPMEVESEQAVTVTVLVANTGGTEGSYTVVLEINGVEEAEKLVTVAAGSSETVDFTLSREEPGDYTVSIASLGGSFSILTPPVSEAAEPEAPSQPPAEAAALDEEGGVNWYVIGVVIGIVVLLVILLPILIRRRRAG